MDMDMQEIETALALALKEGADRIIISNKKDRQYEYRRVEVRSVVIKGEMLYQISCYTDKQVFSHNVKKEELCGGLLAYFPNALCQMNIYTKDKEYAFRATKKGKLLKNVLCRKTVMREASSNTHNRKKNYILQEGTLIPPLVDMGIFTKEGRVAAPMYDKFKQINRFIELVDDVLKNEAGEVLHIIDFGCGKSYLTFILYYYLTVQRGKRAEIIGLDLKKDVIEKCNRTAKRYGYDGLRFELGDINGYQSDAPVDMVVTLHACDTATDYALYNAVQWHAKYILSVPCCQHEVNGQMKSDVLAPMMKYGIIRERTAALATDALRGNMLEYHGYKTQLLEFVDMAHSPKNILIRAVKGNISRERRQRALNEAQTMCGAFGIEPTILKLLGPKQDAEV